MVSVEAWKRSLKLNALHFPSSWCIFSYLKLFVCVGLSLLISIHLILRLDFLNRETVRWNFVSHAFGSVGL